MTSVQRLPVGAQLAGGPPNRTRSVAQLQAAYRSRRDRPQPFQSVRPETGRPETGWAADGCAARVLGDGGRSGARAELPAGWVTVIGAAPGVGGSTVALAIADAAAARVPAHLIEVAPPAHSGLVGAPSAELGVDRAGGWRHGTRGLLVIDRRASNSAPDGWPADPAGSGVLTVADMGPASVDGGGLRGQVSARIVIVCRATVPGIVLVERLLEQLAAGRVLVAALGPARWPAPVAIACGPRLRTLRRTGRVVPVPLDRRLEVTGPTSAPLPRQVRAAGRILGELLGQPIGETDRVPACPWPPTRAGFAAPTGSTGRGAAPVVTVGGWS